MLYLSKTVLTAALLAATGITVTGHGLNQTHDCKGGTASVTGHDNTLRFKDCATLSIAGHNNTVATERVPQINLAGHDNTLAWSGEKPAISQLGRSNVTHEPTSTSVPVERRKLGEMEVQIAGSAPSGASPLSVTENGLVRAHDCSGAAAVIEGNSNTLTLSHCKVRVNGNLNRLTLTDCPTLALLGNGNAATWKGSKPQVSSLGSDNTVEP